MQLLGRKLSRDLDDAVVEADHTLALVATGFDECEEEVVRHLFEDAAGHVARGVGLRWELGRLRARIGELRGQRLEPAEERALAEAMERLAELPDADAVVARLDALRYRIRDRFGGGGPSGVPAWRG